jgi:hypothetical protein
VKAEGPSGAPSVENGPPSAVERPKGPVEDVVARAMQRGPSGQSAASSKQGPEGESEPALLTEEGLQRFAQESHSDGVKAGVVRKKRTKRQLSKSTKRARTRPVHLLQPPSDSSSQSAMEKRLPDAVRAPRTRFPILKPPPNDRALLPLPSNLDRTASNLSMDALAKAAALAERGGLQSPGNEEGGERMEPPKRARVEEERENSESGDELPICKMARRSSWGNSQPGSFSGVQRPPLSAASVIAEDVKRQPFSAAEKGIQCPKKDVKGVQCPVASESLETRKRLSGSRLLEPGQGFRQSGQGFTKLPTGPSLIRSTAVTQPLGGANRAQPNGPESSSKPLGIQPGGGNRAQPSGSQSQSKPPGIGGPVAQQWSKPGSIYWSEENNRVSTSGAQPLDLRLEQQSREMNVWTLGVNTPNPSFKLPHRMVAPTVGVGSDPRKLRTSKSKAGLELDASNLRTASIEEIATVNRAEHANLVSNGQTALKQDARFTTEHISGAPKPSPLFPNAAPCPSRSEALTSSTKITPSLPSPSKPPPTARSIGTDVSLSNAGGPRSAPDVRAVADISNPAGAFSSAGRPAFFGTGGFSRGLEMGRKEGPARPQGLEGFAIPVSLPVQPQGLGGSSILVSLPMRPQGSGGFSIPVSLPARQLGLGVSSVPSALPARAQGSGSFVVPGRCNLKGETTEDRGRGAGTPQMMQFLKRQEALATRIRWVWLKVQKEEKKRFADPCKSSDTAGVRQKQTIKDKVWVWLKAVMTLNGKH